MGDWILYGGNRRDMIKLIAALCMLIDHTGLILFPESLAPRIIGRLSMPLFAYALAKGYEHIRMKRAFPRYVTRLLIFAAVSQLPYRYMIGDSKTLNIGFTWTAAVCVLCAIDRKRYNEPDFTPPFVVAGLVLTFAVVAGLKTDYGIYGILLPATFWYAIKQKKDPFRAITLLAALWGVYTLAYGGSILNIAGVLAVPIAELTVRTGADTKIKLPKGFYYAFYPAHITALLIIKLILTKGA